MYERFTDRARRAMQMANQEAHRLNHEYIGTEHILLGLIADEASIATQVLERLGVDLQKASLEVEKIVRAGPDMVAMGRLPQTPRAKKVIEYAIESARERDDNYVGTEHLLFGLLRGGEGIAYRILSDMKVSEDSVKQGIRRLVHGKEDSEVAKQIATLNAHKESAVSEQDFERAVELMREIRELTLAKEKKDAEVMPSDKLKQISCVLFLHFGGGSLAAEAVSQIKEILKD